MSFNPVKTGDDTVDRNFQAIAQELETILARRLECVPAVRGNYRVNGYEDVLVTDSTQAPVQILLLDASAAERPLYIIRPAAGDNSVTVKAITSGQTINGEQTLSLSFGQAVTLVSDGKRYWTV
jgi:hypothetical protein